MPKYTYKCKECEVVISVIHGMNERLTCCENCDKLDTLIKIPSSISIIHKDTEVGKIVESQIEETKRDLIEEKERISKLEYTND